MNMSNLCRFEGRLKKLRWWLEHVEKRMTTDMLEAKQRGPEKAVLEQVEQYQQEILKERFALTRKECYLLINVIVPVAVYYILPDFFKLLRLCPCRDSFERLCQEGQALNEGGRGDGNETRVSAQLQSQHQALLRRVRERVHSCQITLQEQQAFEETLQTTWTWLNGAQERLASLNSTIGNKETLEKRLGLVQVGK